MSTDFNCYGFDNKEDFFKSIKSSITFKVMGPTGIATSLLSDAQEEISMGMAEAARKTINRAKLVINTDWDLV